MRRPATLLITLLLVASCGDDDAATTTTAPPTTDATTTTTAVVTTVTDATTTLAPTTTAVTTTTIATTTTAAPVYLIDPTDFFPDVFGADGDPHGSGCVTGGSGVLPAGVWFGFATAVSGGTIAFDLACFFTGDAAVAAATADGAEAFDFYIRNQNPSLYSVPISGSAQVYYVDMTSGPEPTPIALADWPTSESYVPCPGEYCAVWLYVNGGVATGIVEQYLP